MRDPLEQLLIKDALLNGLGMMDGNSSLQRQKLPQGEPETEAVNQDHYHSESIQRTVNIPQHVLETSLSVQQVVWQ